MITMALEKQNCIRQKVSLANGKSIVLVDVSGRRDIPIKDSNSNVYCVDDSYNILWVINTGERESTSRDSFVALTYGDGILQARRFFGKEYDIDLNNGNAREVGWNK